MAKIAWLSISPSSTKDTTMMQISTTSSTPRSTCSGGCRERATPARPPPGLRGDRETNAANNQ